MTLSKQRDIDHLKKKHKLKFTTLIDCKEPFYTRDFTITTGFRESTSFKYHIIIPNLAAELTYYICNQVCVMGKTEAKQQQSKKPIYESNLTFSGNAQSSKFLFEAGTFSLSVDDILFISDLHFYDLRRLKFLKQSLKTCYLFDYPSKEFREKIEALTFFNLADSYFDLICARLNSQILSMSKEGKKDLLIFLLGDLVEPKMILKLFLALGLIASNTENMNIYYFLIAGNHELGPRWHDQANPQGHANSGNSIYNFDTELAKAFLDGGLLIDILNIEKLILLSHMQLELHEKVYESFKRPSLIHIHGHTHLPYVIKNNTKIISQFQRQIFGMNYLNSQLFHDTIDTTAGSLRDKSILVSADVLGFEFVSLSKILASTCSDF